MKRNKKMLCVIIPILLVVSLIVVGIIIINNDDSVLNNKKEENYIAYVSINPLVKLDFRIECQNNDCDEPIITSYELVNEDAKEIYKDISFNGEKLNDVLEILTSTAEDNNIDSEYINIYTDWIDSTNYMPTNSEKHQYIVKHLETEELTSDEFEEELVSDPYIVAKVEIPAPIEFRSCDSTKTRVKYNYDEDAHFVCGPSESCEIMTYESHPDMWKGVEYICLFADVNGCVVKIPVIKPIIKVRIRTKQSIYDKFQKNKCYELTPDNYCACKDSVVTAEFSQDNLGIGKHKVEATIKSSSTIEILPFENGYPYVELELIENEYYEQAYKKCLEDKTGTTFPAPTCSD